MDELIRGSYTAAQGRVVDLNKSRLILRTKVFYQAAGFTSGFVKLILGFKK